MIEDKKTVTQIFNVCLQKCPPLKIIVTAYKNPTTQLVIQTVKYNGDQAVMAGQWVVNHVLRTRNVETPTNIFGTLLKKFL